MKIFVSTANVRFALIRESVQALARAGFRDIELSGGTQFYPEMLSDLRKLREEHGLTYRVHNYFPPPEKPFVLNLASSEPGVLESSRALVRKAIDLSVELGAREYGFHAGFRINPRAEELGKPIGKSSVAPYREALEGFMREFSQLEKYAHSRGVALYIENNVVSARNFENFGRENPFLLTCMKEHDEMQAIHPFKLLLDVAHLKVSCKTLGLDFTRELSALVAKSDYLHLSDNDALSDSNLEIREDCDLFKQLSKLDLKGKTLTLEIGDGIESGQRTFKRVEKLARGAA